MTLPFSEFAQIQVDAITEQIAYPDFIKVDRELNRVYEEVNYMHIYH